MKRDDQIIKRIKDRRTELGLSYQALAEKTGMSKSTLQRYETGAIKNVPLSKLEVFASALNTTPEYLMGFRTRNRPIGLSRSRILRAGIPEFEDIMQLHWSWVIIEAYKHKGKETQQAVCNVLGIEYVSSEMNDHEIMELENAISDFAAPEDPYAEDWE